MTRFRVSVIAMAIAVVGAPAATAEPASPAKAATGFGKCLVNADRSAAIRIFQQLPADGTSVDLGTLGGGCAKGATMVSAMQARGGIAEALYLRDFKEAGLQPRRAAGELAQLGLPDGAADASGVFALSGCVARARVLVMDKLFATAPGSAREGEVIAGLMPSFAACKPAGTQVALKRSDIRPLLAQSAYDANIRYWASQTAAR